MTSIGLTLSFWGPWLLQRYQDVWSWWEMSQMSWDNSKLTSKILFEVFWLLFQGPRVLKRPPFNMGCWSKQGLTLAIWGWGPKLGPNRSQTGSHCNFLPRSNSLGPLGQTRLSTGLFRPNDGSLWVLGPEWGTNILNSDQTKAKATQKSIFRPNDSDVLALALRVLKPCKYAQYVYVGNVAWYRYYKYTWPINHRDLVATAVPRSSEG